MASRISVAVLSGFILVTGVGCQSGGGADGADGGDVRAVSLAEFARTDGGIGNTVASAYSEQTSLTPTAPVTPDRGPTVTPTDASGTTFVVDRMVGQVNGRPIYAESFFETIDAELAAMASELTAPQFMRAAGKTITGHLYQVVLNELVLAEAEAGLTSQQQQGLFHVLTNLREQIVAGNRGSSVQTEESLQSEFGVSLAGKVQQEKDQMLIQDLFRREIMPHVIVTWRDVEAEYQRRFAEFNPPGTMTVARIRVSNTDKESVDAVRTQLASGASFESVAREQGQWSDGAWQTLQLDEDGIDGLELQDVMKTQLRSLAVGQTSPAFSMGTSTWWLHLTRVDQPPARTLFDTDLQRQLRREIFGRRQEEEQRRYVDSLLQKGIYDELTEMASQLLEIARLRYTSA